MEKLLAHLQPQRRRIEIDADSQAKKTQFALHFMDVGINTSAWETADLNLVRQPVPSYHIISPWARRQMVGKPAQQVRFGWEATSSDRTEDNT